MQPVTENQVNPSTMYGEAGYDAASGMPIAQQPPTSEQPVAPQPAAFEVEPAPVQALPVPMAPAAALPTNEAAPTIAMGTAGNAAAESAMLGKSPASLVATLVASRNTNGANGVTFAQFATAMAAALGMSFDDAMVLTDAMSRGGIDAKEIARGIDALRHMATGERAGWLAKWLPAAKAASYAVATQAGDDIMRMFGASESVVTALGNFAATNVMMIDRNAKLPAGQTLEQRAQIARESAAKRLSRGQGAESLITESAKAAADPETRVALATDLARTFSITPALANQLVDVMRGRSQVGRLIADGLMALENLGSTPSGFAQGFFATVAPAIAAESAIAANAFKHNLGPTSPEDVRAIATLADFIAAMQRYGQAVAKAKAA